MQKKLAVISAMAGYGRASITVTLPIVSYLGVQCCPVPTSILSNNTGFPHFFFDDYTDKTPAEMEEILRDKVVRANIPSMVVTLGGDGSVYADCEGNSGFCPPRNVQVMDTTGAGDAFCAGVASGLTYGKTLSESVEIGTMLAASVITSNENVCPRFQPAELGLCYPKE